MLFPLKQYEEELTYKLYIGTDKSCKFNEKAILRTDSKTQMEILAKGVQNGMRKVNEARELLDLPSRSGWRRASYEWKLYSGQNGRRTI